MNDWQPIETVPEGVHVLLWFPSGEKGGGGIEAATVFWVSRDQSSFLGRQRLSYWSHGGPGYGRSWFPEEDATFWRELPAAPEIN